MTDIQMLPLPSQHLGEPDDYRETMPKEWREGYRAAMNDAASVARELYAHHVHHAGTDGLLERCKEAEQVFLGDAEKMLSLRHDTGGKPRRKRLPPVRG